MKLLFILGGDFLMKIKALLILLLIIFVSCGVVSATDLNDSNINLQESTIEQTSNQISDYNNIKEERNIDENIIADDIVISKKEANLLKEDDGTVNPSTHTLTEESWTDYFDNADSLKSDVVSEGDVLVFNGEFSNHFMMIDIPVNITGGQQQAVLTDCLIYVTASNVNITGLNIENIDYDEYVIFLDDVSNIIIRNNNISLTNNDDGVTTHALDIQDSNNILIADNNIYTSGPEENLNYQTGACVTNSINAQNSNNITIDSNNITTEDNGNTRRYGTIYGVFLYGNNQNSPCTGNRITNNKINTNGKYYMYSLSLLFNTDFVIRDNVITTTSGEYANGMQLEVVYNGLVNNNTVYTVANNFTYPIYCVGRVAREMIYSTNNIFSNNTLYAESSTTYLYEFFLVKNSTIIYSNMSANVSYGTAIGTSQAAHNKYEYNNINITFSMDKRPSNPDAVPDSPTGITITTIQQEAGINNTIRYNNITVQSPNNETIPAINLISTNNTAYNNYLISTQGLADDAVTYTTGNIVYNNYPASIKNVTIPLDDINMYADESESININVFDEDNNPVNEGTITIYIDDQLQEEYNLTDDILVYEIKNLKTGTHNLTLNYIPLDEMTYNNATNTSTITVNKKDTIITADKIDDTQYKNTLTITGKLTKTDEQTITDNEINISLNNKQYTVVTDITGTFTLNITANTIGTNNLTITYDGNDIYNSYTYNTTFQVEKQNITISIDPITDTKYKANTTITGKITDITGKPLYNINANIRINGKQYKAKTDKTGTFTLTLTPTTIGNNNVIISYGGNNYYNSNETTTTFNVDKQDIIITYDAIADAKYKDDVTITGKIKDINEKGLYNINALITINGKLYKAKTDSTGAFTLTLAAKTIGSNNITISYGGNANYNSYETNTTFNVDKQDIIITYDAIADTKYKDDLTITGKITDINQKALYNINALITINKKQYKAKTDKTGTFTLTLTPTTVGNNNITISYAGNNYYNSNETSTIFNVEKQDITITYEPVVDTLCGENVTITGKVSDVTGKALYNINANIRINGKLYKAKTDTSGAFTLSVATTIVGINNVTLGYAGNANYNSYETSTTFNVLEKTA